MFLIFINSKGEALVNDKISDIIDFIKVRGIPVRLLSNGYLLGKDEYINIANKCDEIRGKNLKKEEGLESLKIKKQVERR